jgi:hypothetical protein
MRAEPGHRRRGRHPHLRNRISRRHRWWLYLCSSLLFASGVGWLAGHYALRGDDLISQGAPHPSEVWWLRLHGAALLGFLVAFGALLPRHIADGWRHGLNRDSGLAVIAMVIVLTLTGYGLYYATGDTIHGWVSVVHWSIGLGSFAALIWHVVRGRSLSAGAHRRERLN